MVKAKKKTVDDCLVLMSHQRRHMQKGGTVLDSCQNVWKRYNSKKKNPLFEAITRHAFNVIDQPELYFRHAHNDTSVRVHCSIWHTNAMVDANGFFFSFLAYSVIVVTLFRLCMFFYVLHIEIFRDSSIEIRRATGSIDSVGIYRWRQIRLNFLGTPIWPFHRLIVWIGKQCEHRSFLTHILWREMIYVVVVFVENQAKVSFLP